MSARLPHFLVGGRTSVLRRAFASYAATARRGRLARILAGSAALAPFRTAESIIHGRAARSFELHPEPVFIIGHWQGGHSWLHELLSRDPQFAMLQLRHCISPGSFRVLRPFFQRHLAKRLPSQRGVDSLKMGLDAPQGDDFLLAGLTRRSIYYAYAFPDSAALVFDDTLMLAGASSQEVEAWQTTYKRAWQGVAAEQGKTRFVSRNASNTTRIPQLLAMFPKARFVHMHRHPAALFSAQDRRWRSLTGRWALQSPNFDQLRQHTFVFFERMMKKYLTDRALVPSGQLIDIEYEELRSHPIRVLEQVYQGLGLGGFDEARPCFESFVSQANGELALAELTEGELADVRERWGFAYSEFGYDDAQRSSRVA